MRSWNLWHGPGTSREGVPEGRSETLPGAHAALLAPGPASNGGVAALRPIPASAGRPWGMEGAVVENPCQERKIDRPPARLLDTRGKGGILHI